MTNDGHYVTYLVVWILHSIPSNPSWSEGIVYGIVVLLTSLLFIPCRLVLGVLNLSKPRT